MLEVPVNDEQLATTLSIEEASNITYWDMYLGYYYNTK